MRLALGTGEDDHDHEQRRHGSHADAARDRERPAAAGLGGGRGPVAPPDQDEQLGDAEEDEVGATCDGGDLERERRLEHDSDAQHQGRHAAQHAASGRAGPLEQAREAPRGGLDVAGVERGRGAGQHDAEQPKQQAPADQVAQVGVDQPRGGVAHLLVGHLVLADHPGDHSRLEDQQRDREQRPGCGHADADAQHRDAAVRAERDCGDEQQHGRDREQQPEQAQVVGDRQRLARELVAVEAEDVRVDVVGYVARELGRDRLHGESDDRGRVAEVHERVALLPDEEDLVRLEGGAPEDLAERPGLHDRVDDRLEQRPGGNEVGRAAVDQVDDDLARDEVAQPVVVERRDGAVGERLAVDDLLARVEGDNPGEQEDRAEYDQDHARHAPGPNGEPGHLLARL